MHVWFQYLSIFSFLFCIFLQCPSFIFILLIQPLFSFINAFIKFRFQSDSFENDSVTTPICNFEHPIDCGEIEEEEEETDPSAELLRLVEEEEKEIQPH